MHKILLLIIIFAIFFLGFFITRETLSKIYADLRSGGITAIEKSGCDADCQKEISDQVARAIATFSATPKIVAVNKAVTVSSKPQDAYIQISGSGSTQKTEWTDISGSDFSFDINKDFDKGAKFAWEGFLRVNDANSTAFARIFDVTHSIGVDGSEISVANKSEYTRTNSTNLNFWAGRNVYRIQIKSLNTINVDYMGGKIRVSY
jgi:hypothetical protein